MTRRLRVERVVGADAVCLFLGDFSKTGDEMTTGFLVEHQDELAAGRREHNDVVRVGHIRNRTKHVSDENRTHLVQWMRQREKTRHRNGVSADSCRGSVFLQQDPEMGGPCMRYGELKAGEKVLAVANVNAKCS